MRIIFLPNIMGFGHINRCVSVARALERLKPEIELCFMMKTCEEEAKDLLRIFGVKTLFYETFENLKMMLKEGEGSKFVLVEDWVFFPYDTINPESFVYVIIVQPNLMYPESRLKKANFLLSCAPLWFTDPQLASLQQKTVKCGPLLNLLEEEDFDKKRSREYLQINPRSFVITVLGGGGTYGLELYDLVAQSLPYLSSVFQNLLIFFVLGPHASYYSVESYERLGIFVRRCVNSTFLYFKASDVVVSHGGYQTMMEVLKSGAPAVFFPRNSEQRLNLEKFSFPWFRTLKTLDAKEFSGLIHDVATIENKSLKIDNGAYTAAESILQCLREKSNCGV